MDPTSCLSTKANKTASTTKKDVGVKAWSSWRPQCIHSQNALSSSVPGPFILGQTQAGLSMSLCLWTSSSQRARQTLRIALGVCGEFRGATEDMAVCLPKRHREGVRVALSLSVEPLLMGQTGPEPDLGESLFSLLRAGVCVSLAKRALSQFCPCPPAGSLCQVSAEHLPMWWVPGRTRRLRLEVGPGAGRSAARG